MRKYFKRASNNSEIDLESSEHTFTAPPMHLKKMESIIDRECCSAHYYWEQICIGIEFNNSQSTNHWENPLDSTNTSQVLSLRESLKDNVNKKMCNDAGVREEMAITDLKPAFSCQNISSAGITAHASARHQRENAINWGEKMLLGKVSFVCHLSV